MSLKERLRFNRLVRKGIPLYYNEQTGGHRAVQSYSLLRDEVVLRFGRFGYVNSCVTVTRPEYLSIVSKEQTDG